jgi:hypothetical protein
MLQLPCLQTAMMKCPFRYQHKVPLWFSCDSYCEVIVPLRTFCRLCSTSTPFVHPQPAPQACGCGGCPLGYRKSISIYFFQAAHWRDLKVSNRPSMMCIIISLLTVPSQPVAHDTNSAGFDKKLPQVIFNHPESLSSLAMRHQNPVSCAQQEARCEYFKSTQPTLSASLHKDCEFFLTALHSHSSKVLLLPFTHTSCHFLEALRTHIT